MEFLQILKLIAKNDNFVLIQKVLSDYIQWFGMIQHLKN